MEWFDASGPEHWDLSAEDSGFTSVFATPSWSGTVALFSYAGGSVDLSSDFPSFDKLTPIGALSDAIAAGNVTAIRLLLRANFLFDTGTSFLEHGFEAESNIDIYFDTLGTDAGVKQVVLEVVISDPSEGITVSAVDIPLGEVPPGYKYSLEVLSAESNAPISTPTFWTRFNMTAETVL